MPLILMHSPKGGVGNTFLAAQLALSLAARGHEVSALDFTFQDALKLHFAFPPEQCVPDLGDREKEPLVACGVSLRQGHRLAARPDFEQYLRNPDADPFDEGRVYIADLPSEDQRLPALLMPHCALRICTLTPTAAALATLPKMGQDKPVVLLDRTVFILNQMDDRYRLSRHTDNFMRDIFGDRFIARIRRDEAVNEALARFEPVAKYAPESAALPDIAQFALAVERRLGLRPDPELAAAGQEMAR